MQLSFVSSFILKKESLCQAFWLLYLSGYFEFFFSCLILSAHTPVHVSCHFILVWSLSIHWGADRIFCFYNFHVLFNFAIVFMFYRDMFYILSSNIICVCTPSFIHYFLLNPSKLNFTLYCEGNTYSNFNAASCVT